MDLNRPDVYVQDVKTGASPIQSASTTIGILIGAARSGVIGEPVLCGSWTEFIANFANGLETPFMSNSDLPYAVYDFFANGGQQVYVVRVANDSATKASVTGATNTELTLTAKYKGVSSTVAKIKKNEDWTEANKLFDVTISASSAEDGTVTIKEVTPSTIVDAINSNTFAKEWVVASGTVTTLAEETMTLIGGVDNVAGYTDSTYIGGLSACDTIDDASFIAIPGQTSVAVHDAIMTYADNHKLFPILDPPLNSEVKAVKTYRKSISAFTGALPYPWIYMLDPLTETNKLIPPSGFYMGVSARIIGERGVGKAPAGTEAVVRGALALERVLTDSDISQLNPVGVIPIVPRTGAGIVVWGARSLSSDAQMRYVSDGHINYNIKKSLYSGTQFAVFEQNDPSLWSRVKATCEDFLETLRINKVLKGDTPAEAYYVVCDSTNNTQASIDNGILYVDIGYAPQKPAEFIVFRLAHNMANASA